MVNHDIMTNTATVKKLRNPDTYKMTCMFLS